MQVRCVRCWRMYSDTRQQYACPHSEIGEHMTTERAHKIDCRYSYGEGCTCNREGGKLGDASLVSAAIEQTISEDGRIAMFQEQLAVTNQIAQNKRQIEVACDMIALATTENKALNEKRARLDRDLARGQEPMHSPTVRITPKGSVDRY